MKKTDPVLLGALLAPYFKDGQKPQIQFETPSFVHRGEASGYSIDGNPNRVIKIDLNWMLELRPFVDRNGSRFFKGYDIPLWDYRDLILRFTGFYLQPHKNRVKIFTDREGEILRIFNSDSGLNLNGDRISKWTITQYLSVLPVPTSMVGKISK